MNRVMRWGGRAGMAWVVLMLVAPPAVGAQQRDLPRREGWRPSAPGRVPARLQERLQERLDTLVRSRLQLTGEQFTQLQAVATRLEEERMALRRDEVLTRTRLRRALAGSETVDQGAVALLLDEIPRHERRKVELLEREQKELAQFLTPSQRARYMALQEELRRGMQEVQRRRLGLDGGGRRDGVPPQDAPPRRPPW